MQKLLICIYLCLLLSLETWAQDQSISGTVTDANSGLPLSGVSITLKGNTSKNGTLTNINGQYSLTVQEGATLIYAIVGYTTREILIGSETEINISLTPSTQNPDGLISTAQAIQREKKALGFAASIVKNQQIANRTEGDLVRNLRSKISGVNITQQNGISGSGNNIIIRGYTSLIGSNQALFIVDGVPFNTSTHSIDGSVGEGSFVDGTSNGSSRSLDLDPNNIETITVLKGLAATTLYGERGRNGVLMITTKTGSNTRKKSSISVSQSLFVNEIASLPDYQNQFGNGFNQEFGWFTSNWGPSFSETGFAGWGADANIDANGNLPHPYSQYTNPSLRAAFPEFTAEAGQGVAGRTLDGEVLYGTPYKWRSYNNNVQDFFRTGLVSNTTVSANGSSKNGNTSFGATFSYLADQGFTPGNTLNRLNFSIGASSKLSQKILINATLNLSRTDYSSLPISASDGSGAFSLSRATPVSSSVFGHLFFTPRSIDLMNLPFESPVDGSSVYYRNGNDIQNPRWTAKNAFLGQLTNRIYGTLGASYHFNDHLDIAYRLGYDIYNEQNESGQHKGGIDGPVLGAYRNFDNQNTIWDHTFFLNGDYQFGDISLKFNLGANITNNSLDREGTNNLNQSVFGIFRQDNFTMQNAIRYSASRTDAGIFGQAELGYKKYLFLTLAGRYDILPDLSVENNAIFSPGVSTSFILSEVAPAIKDIGISLLKLRLGYASTAGYGRASFPTSSELVVLVGSLNSDRVVRSVVTTLESSRIKPELNNELELGFEAKAWKNKIHLGISWYHRVSRDLILAQSLEPIISSNLIRRMVSSGLEIDANINVLQIGDFHWNICANFTRQTNEVKVTDFDTKFAYAGFNGLGNFIEEGQPLGVIQGNRILRNENGDRVVDSFGDYEVEEGTFVIGNPNPDFTLNFCQALSFKGFTLSAVINYVQGGDVYARTVSALLGRGVTTDTEDRTQSFVLPGVRNLGTDQNPNYVTNDIQIDTYRYNFNNIFLGPDELSIYDATTIRLQEISLSYTFPQSIIDKTPFGNITLIFSGFNLWYNAVNMPKGTNFDPNSAGFGVGNGQGFDWLNGPSARRYGGTIKLSF